MNYYRYVKHPLLEPLNLHSIFNIVSANPKVHQTIGWSFDTRDFPELDDVRKKLELHDYANFFEISPDNPSFPCHIDYDFKANLPIPAVLNFPLINCTGHTETIFYRETGPVQTFKGPASLIAPETEGLSLAEKVSFKSSDESYVLLRSSQWHTVRMRGFLNGPRIMFSWRFKVKNSWDDIIAMFNQ